MKNLSIYFDSFNPGWPMEIRILGGRVMNPIFDGQVHRYELSPGEYTLCFRFNGIESQTKLDITAFEETKVFRCLRCSSRFSL